jgi:hypothetical protein
MVDGLISGRNSIRRTALLIGRNAMDRFCMGPTGLQQIT